MRRLPAIAIAAAALASAWSCKEERQSFVPDVNGAAVPTMTTRDVSTFISDSGYTRYHITTPVWQMFEDAPEPFWKFPEGMHLEQYDEQLRPAANIVCDSATYHSRRRLWQLDGNVVMVNTLRDSFLTQQLFWDQARQLVYSDSFIHIVRSDRIIDGYGFESNQNMTAYTVNRPTGIIPVSRPGAQPAANAGHDTLPAAAAPSATAPARASERQPAPAASPFRMAPTSPSSPTAQPTHAPLKRL